jgi:glycosyltransferase involved in cell wall biosynthesis
LERLKDFADIIVCDGNSTDGTQDVAQRYGARVIKQYDTDEPNVPCAMDKATVRERAMAASKYEWRFFMDADDTLSEEAVEEIREIVSGENPTHFIYRMPTRIFIDGKEILYEATYPSYQTRLVHASVGARFKGPVHDHLVWDMKKFPVGTMKNFYNFEWSKERVTNYWRYVSTYVWREVDTMHLHRSSLSDFAYWGVYRRLRIGLGYIVWRLPTMYLRHGFRDSMPFSLELQIAAQHFYILFAGIIRFITSRPLYVMTRAALSGERQAHALRNIAVRDFEAYGRVLEVGQKRGDYWEYLQTHRWHRDKRVTAQDFSSAQEGYFDTVLLFNANTSNELLSRARKALRSGGVLIGDSHDNPQSLLVGNGFSRVQIIPLRGMGFVYRGEVA